MTMDGQDDRKKVGTDVVHDDQRASSPPPKEGEEGATTSSVKSGITESFAERVGYGF